MTLAVLDSKRFIVQTSREFYGALLRERRVHVLVANDDPRAPRTLAG
jgi:hypothetical protein